MADIDQLTQALQNAHAAGDTQAATALAAALRSMQGADNSPESMAATLTPHSLGQKIGMGIGDIGHGITQSFAHAPPVEPYATSQEEADTRDQGQTLGPAYDALLANREKTWQDKRTASGDKGFEWGRLGGNILGAAPLMAAAAPAVPESLMGTIGMGGLTGGVNAGLMPVTSGDYGKEKGKQVGAGAAGGALFSGAGYGLGRLVGGAGVPKTDYEKSVAYLQERGVQPTLGQLAGKTGAKIEDVAQPLSYFGQERALGQFNKAAYNQVLAPIGEKFDGEAGRDAVRIVGDKLSAAYENLVPKLKLVPDAQLQTDFANAIARTDEMSEAAAKQFSNIIEKQLPRGPLEGEALKKLQSALTEKIQQFSGSQDPSHAMMVDAFSDIRTAITENLARVNPESATALQAIDHGWANLVRLEMASGKTKDGVFTPNQLLSAARQADQTIRSRAVARGMGGDMQDLADAGIRVLGNSYPNSGTPARLAVGALEGGGLTALSTVHPGAAAALLGTGAAYTPWGQKAISAIAGQRSGNALPLMGEGLKRAAVPMGLMAGPGVASLMGP